MPDFFFKYHTLMYTLQYRIIVERFYIKNMKSNHFLIKKED